MSRYDSNKKFTATEKVERLNFLDVQIYEAARTAELLRSKIPECTKLAKRLNAVRDLLRSMVNDIEVTIPGPPDGER